MQNITTVLTDDQDRKHNNCTNRRSGYKTLKQDKQTIRIQNFKTGQTDHEDTKHNDSTNRR